jgi:diguanylate cyclase (GGDEF)-like protein
MDVSKFVPIRSNEKHYIYLFIVSIVLVVWQYFGMSQNLVIIPGASTSSKATIFSDLINGGRSESKLSNEAEEIRLDCSIVLSDTFAFCGVSIPLVAEGEMGVDMRKYSQMQIELEYTSAKNDTLLVYLTNEEYLVDGAILEKSNLWAVSPQRGVNKFLLTPHRFIVPSWWIYKNSSKGLNLEPDISNVTSLQITTGDNTEARDVGISIRRISFSGKWILADDLYPGLLIAWLALIVLHGLRTMRVLTVRFKQSKEQNKKLVKLNRFLRIQKNQYETMAKKDKLTDAWNRAGVRDLLEYVLEKYKVYGTPCTLLVLDVDHFKKVNDEFGHDAGDRALKALVALVNSYTRNKDFLARWGGEEFVLICPGTDIHAAKTLAEMLRHKIETAKLIEEKKITGSFGIAELRDEDIDVWFKRADEALYRAKAAGRNQVESA